MFNFTKREKIIIIGLIAAVVLLASLLIYQHSNNNSTASLINGLDDSSTAGADGAVQGNTGNKATVHVCGEVKKPGVYTLDRSKRVIDAVNAAGGATSLANLNAVNLAAKLVDGKQILIPRQNTGSPSNGSASAAGTGNAGSGSGAVVQVNINTADINALKQLPGIGDVLAQRIIDYRTQHGAFNSIDELKNVSGIGEKKFADLKDSVCVY